MAQIILNNGHLYTLRFHTAKPDRKELQAG